MIPERYFPFPKPEYELKIGALPMGAGDRSIEPDELLVEELALKRACFAYDEGYYFQALPGTEEAQREVAELVQEQSGFAFAVDAVAPMRSAGDAVQEDLLLLDPAQEGVPLIAGHLCFANAWCLDDKMGQPFLAIHGPVPQFDTTIGPPSQKLIERLKPGRPVARLNWAVKPTGQLDCTSRWDQWMEDRKREVTPGNAGATCWMRIERQTLVRMPQSGTVLFTLHTYTQPVESMTVDQQQKLLGVLSTCPEEMLRYKGIYGFWPPLRAWLENRFAKPA